MSRAPAFRKAAAFYFLTSNYKMSLAAPVHGSRFFVSLTAAAPTYTAAGAAGTAQAVNVIVRDLGKTIRTPSTYLSGVTSQLILRKVARVQAQTALVAGQATSFVGFSEGGQDPSLATSVFYINLYDGKWGSVGC